MRRVLIVEDDHLVCDAIEAAFAMKGGFEIAHAEDGEAALATLARVHPSLALIDVGLPKVPGLAIAEAAAVRDVPVILMSGYGEVVARSCEYRFPMLAKPFRASALVDRFDEVVAEAARLRWQAREEIATGQALVAEARSRQRSFSEEWLQICARMLFTRV